MDSLSSERVRSLSLEELGFDPGDAEPAVVVAAPAPPPLSSDDFVLEEVRAALALGFAGVILAGPPGTGKSWYAKRIAETIAEDTDGEMDAVRTVQFHTSYQYEDFMEGFAPTEHGHFAIEQKIFPSLCANASDRPSVTHVLVIDEISRCDVARVFGEALTYIEPDKRDVPFTLASGNTLTVPPNLIIIATMNPWDKGVDELDVALERRFAQIDLLPNADTLRAIVESKGANPAFVDRLVTFFQGLQALEDELYHLGHAYFLHCVDEPSARRVWNFRLHPFFKRACRLDTGALESIRQMWLSVVPPPASTEPAMEPTANPDTPAAPPQGTATDNT